MFEAYVKERKLKKLVSQVDENPVEVLHSLEQLAKAGPFSVNAALLQARCLLLEGQTDESRRVTEKALAHDPGNIYAKVRLAKILHDQNDTATSIELLREVTNARPELIENWQLLADYLRQQGQEKASKNAMSQFDMIKAFNETLNLAESAFSKAEYARADNICRKLLEKVPGEVRVLRLLARLARQFRHFEISLSILTNCAEIRPTDMAIGFDFATALLDCKKFQESLDQCNRLIDLSPEHLDTYSLKAEVLFNLGRYQDAIDIFRELSKVHKQPELCLTHLGKVLTTVGETDEAVDCFHRAIAEKHDLGQAYWELASLKTYRFSNDEVRSMRQLLGDDDLTAINRVLIEFALGKALEDSEEFAESFKHYASANRGYTKIRPYRYSNHNAALKSFFSQAYFSGQTDAVSDSDAPIFIVGLPRSGSTLVEQIITSHSQVDSTTELTGIVTISRQLNDSTLPGKGQYPQSIARLDNEQLREYARQYLEHAQSYGQGAPYFVDKAPANFNHIGLIKTLFPEARIIDIRRDPMASGWSIYRHFFDDSFLFSYDLANIGKYYNDYIELMDHWHAVLPGQILTLSYEDLVRDLPGHVDRILQYCGLDFEEGCLNFHLNERAIATPSSEQVRQPIFSSALEHWKNYEPYLDLLKQAIRKNDHSEQR